MSDAHAFIPIGRGFCVFVTVQALDGRDFLTVTRATSRQRTVVLPARGVDAIAVDALAECMIAAIDLEFSRIEGFRVYKTTDAIPPEHRQGQVDKAAEAQTRLEERKGKLRRGLLVTFFRWGMFVAVVFMVLEFLKWWLKG